jgi:hypothetical protein
MVRDPAMPGGGAAIKVSRTDQFAPENNAPPSAERNGQLNT